MRILLIVWFIVAASMGLFAQSTFDTCSAEGSAKRSDAKALNIKKNRDGNPKEPEINKRITFDVLMQAGEHPVEFKEGDGAEIVGYVAEIKIGVVETCNCAKKDHMHKDSHIVLTLDPMQQGDKTKLLIVEVTPRFRKIMSEQGFDWSNRGLRDAFLGRWVKVRGWVFYDAMHDDESASSAGTRIWRGSPWEIHPVTHMEITTRPVGVQSHTAASVTEISHASEASEAHESIQCTGKTQKGNRCLRMTTDPSGKCYQHK